MLKELRREFHETPEIGWLEIQTTIAIIDYLKKFGFEVEYGKKIHKDRMGLVGKEELESYVKTLDIRRNYNISEILEGYTGVIGFIDSKKPGKTIAIRADIDGNGIGETEDYNHIPNISGFKSKNKGWMHACGHDGHIAIALGIAKWISDNLDKLTGKYMLIFQPAEEGVRGAKSMVDSGCIKNIDYLFGYHIGLGLSTGEIGVGTKGFLATSKLDVRFKGVASHAGASPELGKNALLAGASASLNLHTLSQFGSGMSRINVGKFSSGTSRNIVPNEANLEIEMRGETEEINEILYKKTIAVLEGSAKAFDLDLEYNQVGGAMAYNYTDKDMVGAISSLIGSKYKIVEGHKLGGSEDITYIMDEVERHGGKALHLIFGSDLTASHHNERFDFDEKTLEIGYEILKTIIKNYSEKQ